MTAQGKINASKLQVNDRIMVQVTEGGVWFSRNKTGEGVQVARVLDKTSRAAQGYESRGKYIIHTTAGSFEAAPIQTMWLAPEDAAGIKRAYAEAQAEDADRAADMLVAEAAEEMDEPSATAQAAADEDRWTNGAIIDAHAEALAEDAERTATPLFIEDDEFEPDGCPVCCGPLASDNVCADDNCGDEVENLLPSPAAGLTLHSQDGKVDSMNNDEVTEHGPIDKAAILAKPIDSLMDSGVKNHTGSAVVALLEKVWTRIREGHPELPEVVITTGSGEGVKWGHFRPESWKVRAEEGAAVTPGAPGRRHELFLSSEALAKGSTQVLQTMLHEAAHTLSRVREISDTSRQGRWHNAQFRKAAEEMGLEHKGSKADKSHGFSFVTLTTATKAQYADLLGQLEREIRLTGLLPSWLGGTGDEDERGGERIGKAPEGEDDEEKPKRAEKATCECAEPVIVRMSPKVVAMGIVRCDDCGELFEHRG